MIVRTIIRTVLGQAFKPPKVQLATEGCILLLLEELRKDKLFKLFRVMSKKASAIGLPRDDATKMRLLQVNMLQHVEELDWEWDLDSTFRANFLPFIVGNHGVVLTTVMLNDDLLIGFIVIGEARIKVMAIILSIM